MELISTIIADISIAEDSFQRAAPHVWAKQQDNGTRKLAVQLQQNGQAYTIPSGATAELRVRRIDGVLVTGACTIAGSTVTGTLSAEMLYTAGDSMAEIRLVQDAQILACQSIVLHVQPCAKGTAHEGYSSDTVNLVRLTKAEYDAMETHDTNTLYYAIDGGNVYAYLGDLSIGSGGGGGDISTLTVRVAALEAQLAGLSFRAVTEEPAEPVAGTVYIVAQAEEESS